MGPVARSPSQPSQQEAGTARRFALTKDNVASAAAKAVACGFRQSPIGPPSRRSCDAADRPIFSLHASQNAASAERESETGGGRLAPVWREFSPRHSPCV